MNFKDLKGLKRFEIHSTSCHQSVMINAHMGEFMEGFGINVRFVIKDYKIDKGISSTGAMRARALPKIFILCKNTFDVNKSTAMQVK